VCFEVLNPSAEVFIMTIQEYLKSHFEKKAKENGCLVLYDPGKKYKPIIRAITGCEVIDAESSTILGRETAMDLWKKLGDEPDTAKNFLAYLPIEKPVKDEEIRENPYLIFEIGGAAFPRGDEDNLQSLCRKAFPDKVHRIDDLFSHDPNPEFEAINAAVASDKGWPILRSLLESESTKETLLGFLSPNPKQKQSLETSKTWVNEYKQLVKHSLGLPVKSKSQNREFLADELWRYLLYSEFVFDLPEELPGSLKKVPHAVGQHQSLTYSICDDLRSGKKHMELYISKANEVVKELDLENQCRQIDDFGKRDTFAFEEKSFLALFARSVISHELTRAEKILQDRSDSLWVKNDETRQLSWTIAERSLQLLKEIETAETLVNHYGKDLDTLTVGYCERFYSVDKLHRNFEQVVSETYGQLSPLDDLVSLVRETYDRFTGSIQEIFITLVKKYGWPVESLLSSSRIFGEFIEKPLQARNKVAFFLVDALRYELGVELESLLNHEYNVEMKAVCAQLPTTTAVGMSALMPGTEGKLTLKFVNDSLKPLVNDCALDTAADRMKYLYSIYGDRFYSLWLDDFIKTPTIKIPGNINLLVLKTRDIDDLGENLPHEAISLVPKMIKKISAAVHRLKEMKFNQIVISADHGFIFKNEFKAGDKIEKPPGEWKLEKSRCLMGKGSVNSYTVGFAAESLGIKSDCPDYVVPKGSGTFYKGSIYFHEGLSLQECILPTLSISLQKTREAEEAIFTINLGYKGGRTDFITTRRPMVEISMASQKLFHEVEIQLEAYSYPEEKLIGEPAQCKDLNPATNLIALQRGTPIKVPLKMAEDFEGEFEVKAIDPVTQVTYNSIKLKTDYVG
jgi:hypothetical protein